MSTKNENIIPEIFKLTVNSVKELSDIVYSLKNTEVAYNDFVAKNLKSSIKENDYLNLYVETEHRIPTGRIDITISTTNNIIIACEGLRLLYPNKGLIEQQFTRLEKYMLTDVSAYFLIVYNETNDFSKSWLHYKKTIEELNYNIEQVPIIATSSNIELIKTNFISNQKSIPVYHIFANISHEKEEVVTENRLKSISINHLKIFDNLIVELSPNINIILGKNAFGKTSFLQALTLANIPDNHQLPYNEFISKNHKEAEIIIQRENEQEIAIQLNEVGKTSDSLTKYIHEPVFFAYGTNIFSKYINHNYAKLVDELINGTDKWHFTSSIFKEYDESFYDPLGVLNTLNKTQEIRAKKIKDFIIACLNRVLPQEFKIKTDPKYSISHYFVDAKNNLLETQQLSEGYKHNILLLTDIIIRIISIGNKKYTDLKTLFANIKGVIAIDEFDRHMHPSWQKSYINSLSNLLPNIQFVLTTHNPVAILGRKEKEIQMLYYNENNTIDVKLLPETLTVDAGMVLLTHFDMNSILSTELQSKVDDFYNLKTKTSLSENEKKMLSDLQEQLNDTFIGVNIHDFRFLKFLKFLKSNGFDYRERLEELVISDEDVDNFRNEFKEYYK